ncbi:MAG: multidrug effflux MFS transporter [Pseudomonadota bacterium]|nr:multidrug effflux MFS transporter [Pseudomonadota bacterium]
MTPKPLTTVRTLLILSALMAFGPLSTDLYLPALPALGRALRAGPDEMALTLSSYLIGFSFGQLLWGPIGDRYGRRLPVAAGLALFVIGSAGCGASTTAWQMIGWRVVQSVGASAGPVLARAMVRDLYARERSAQMLSTLMTVMAIAPLAGPFVGGQILVAASWRAIFWTLMGLGCAALAALLVLPETLPASRRSRQPLGAAFMGYASLARDSRLIGYAAIGGLYYGGIFAYIAASPFVYIEYYRVRPEWFGLFFALPILGIMAVNLINTRLVMRFGGDLLCRFGAGAAAAAGLVALLEARTGWGGFYGLVAAMVAYGASSGFIVANSVAGALAAFPHRAGGASAFVGAFHYGSGIFSAALVGWLADGTAVPMAAILAAGGVGSFLCTLGLAPVAATPVAVKESALK